MALEQRLKGKKDAFKAAGTALKRFRYPLLAALVGIAILLFPAEKDTQTSAPAAETFPESVENDDVERRLEDILCSISGAGPVRVMLTVKNEGKTTYQADSEVSTSQDTTNSKTQTVFRSDGSYQQIPLVTSVSSPEYLGAVVVCGGGDRAEVRLNVVRAVCSLTGLGSDKVTVLKMEG